jgi:hypothetical protein
VQWDRPKRRRSEAKHPRAPQSTTEHDRAAQGSHQAVPLQGGGLGSGDGGSLRSRNGAPSMVPLKMLGVTGRKRQGRNRRSTSRVGRSSPLPGRSSQHQRTRCGSCRSMRPRCPAPWSAGDVA